MASWSKAKRQKRIRELLQTHDLSSQGELVEILAKEGAEVNQSSVSRDLVELEVIKQSGFYRMPGGAAATSNLGVKTVKSAGNSLLVVQCEPGWASAVSAELDRLQMQEVVGTIAGDDTIFVAVDGARAQKKVKEQILKLANLIQLKT